MSLCASESDVRSEITRALLGWGLSKCAGDIPDRDDLDPADMKLLLPNLFVADVEHHPFRIRYRLVGTRVVQATGMDITGRYLDEMLPANPGGPCMEYHQRGSETRPPVVGGSAAPTATGGA